MFNSKVKETFVRLDAMLMGHEQDITLIYKRLDALNNTLQNTLDSLREDISKLKEQTLGININPLSEKWVCTFNNADGTPNLMLCSKAEHLGETIEIIKKAGGTDFVIKGG